MFNIQLTSVPLQTFKASTTQKQSEKTVSYPKKNTLERTPASDSVDKTSKKDVLKPLAIVAGLALTGYVVWRGLRFWNSGIGAKRGVIIPETPHDKLGKLVSQVQETANSETPKTSSIKEMAFSLDDLTIIERIAKTKIKSEVVSAKDAAKLATMMSPLMLAYYQTGNLGTYFDNYNKANLQLLEAGDAISNREKVSFKDLSEQEKSLRYAMNYYNNAVDRYNNINVPVSFERLTVSPQVEKTISLILRADSIWGEFDKILKRESLITDESYERFIKYLENPPAEFNIFEEADSYIEKIREGMPVLTQKIYSERLARDMYQEQERQRQNRRAQENENLADEIIILHEVQSDLGRLGKVETLEVVDDVPDIGDDFPDIIDIF